MPNEVVFVSMLSAYSHCHVLEEGWKWFFSMEKSFGITPTSAAWQERGDGEKALEFIGRMPFEPDMSIWVALLSWCRTASDDIKIAETAVKQLMRLDMQNTSCIVTLANMYSKLGQWEDAEENQGVD